MSAKALKLLSFPRGKPSTVLIKEKTKQNPTQPITTTTTTKHEKKPTANPQSQNNNPNDMCPIIEHYF